MKRMREIAVLEFEEPAAAGNPPATLARHIPMSEQEAYFASTRGSHAAPPSQGPAATWAKIPGAKPGEPPGITLARQTRNAARFVAWVVGIVIALSAIGGIVVAVNATSSNCMSQGGSNPDC